MRKTDILVYMKKKIISSIIVSGCIIGVLSAFAVSPVGQSQTTSAEMPAICVALKSDGLRYRASDETTDGEVTLLQTFLAQNSFLRGNVTGYFGAGTHGAVKLFQKKYGINQTGYVGTLTKAKINEKLCPDTKKNDQVMCTMEAKLCPDGTSMQRDPLTCKWLESKCEVSVTTPTQGVTSKPVLTNEEQQRLYVCEKKKIVCALGTSTYNSFSCKEVTLMCDQMSSRISEQPIRYPSDPLPPAPTSISDPLPPSGSRLVCPQRALVMCAGGAVPKQIPGTCKFVCPTFSTVPATTTLPTIPKKLPDQVCTDVIRYCPAGVVPKSNDPCSCILNPSI